MRVLCDLSAGANFAATKLILHFATPAVGAMTTRLLQMETGQCTVVVVALSGLTIKVMHPLMIEVCATTQFSVLS